jgi:hypothetical protein
MDRRNVVRSPVLKLRTSSARLIRPDELGAKIENMYPTEEGTLRSIWGPAPWQPYSSSTSPDIDTSPQTYGPMHGICHALIREGQRDVLLVHTGSELWVHQGWDQEWRKLMGAVDTDIATGWISVTLDDSTRAQFPTQFVTTPTGIVVIPQNRRAYFYDGDVILPLGYDRAPPPPVSHGPESSQNAINNAAFAAVSSLQYAGVNDIRYAHDALPGRPSAMHRIFKQGRLGLVVHPTNYTTGYGSSGSNDGDSKAAIASWLEPGEWRGAVQWIDRWGNVSPLSEPSESIRVHRQPATSYATTPLVIYCNGELVRKQFAWSSIAPGPTGTLGRILCRTRDTKQTGDTSFYEVPLNARGTSNPFATLPDNSSTIFPDNVPDEWLFKQPLEVDPVPEFKLATLAFGRLWIANIPGAEGLLRPSEVGRWGTFPKGMERYPDPSAAGITGLHAISKGLLVFTETSTYLIESNDSGDDFRSMPISTKIGCVAPSSIVTVDDGTVIWLARDGFYAYQGGEPKYIFGDHYRDIRDFTKGRLCQAVAAYDERAREYRCWLSVEGSVTNNRCYIFDGQGWRRRNDVKAAAVCVTKDHRAYMLVAGTEDGDNGVWLLDHQVNSYSPASQTYTIETGWMTSADSQERMSPTRVMLWLRESLTSEDVAAKKIDITVYSDWRDHEVHTDTAIPYPSDDTRASYWGDTIETSDLWVRKRPFWTKVDIDVRAAEVFKLKLTSTYPFEFIGLQFDAIPRGSGGAKSPP